jgi:hypothetical protein
VGVVLERIVGVGLLAQRVVLHGPVTVVRVERFGETVVSIVGVRCRERLPFASVRVTVCVSLFPFESYV